MRVRPALSGLIDGSLSTLAPIFAVVLLRHRPLTAFYTGAATALAASAWGMAFSEGLSDTGDLTGRGSPLLHGAITGGGTFAGGIFHTLPFLIANYRAAVSVAIAVVASELLHPGLAASQVLPDQLRPVVPRGHRRRSDHRLPERRSRAGGRRLTWCDARRGWSRPAREVERPFGTGGELLGADYWPVQDLAEDAGRRDQLAKASDRRPGAGVIDAAG